MDQTAAQRSRVPWALALAVGLSAGLAGYVIHAARVNRIPKQIVEVRRLTNMSGTAESPAISPDSNAVAFVAAVGGRRQIWVVPVDAGAPKVITNDDAEHAAPRWSSDSSKLIYFALGAVWEIPAGGGDARKLVDASGPGDLTHNGTSLAYFRVRDGATDLAVGDRTIVKLPAGHQYSNLRWSPDDKKIAYLQDAKIMVVSALGGYPVQAAQDLTLQGFAWAPDNSGLIISSGGPPVFNLWFVPRKEGSSPSQLTFGELSYEFPDISPRGTLVVSRRGLVTGAGTDIVLFSGLKW